MSEQARERFFWIAATLLVAAIVYMGSVYLLPRFIMHAALARLGAPNTIHFGHRPDATSRAVVRPSPDILYATCPYDLSKGPLRVTATVPHAGYYWSISAFDSATNNFFVKNDRDVMGGTLSMTLLRHGQALPPPDAAVEHITLFSPSERGLILFRTVIDDDKHVPALEALLRQARCETVASAPRLR